MVTVLTDHAFHTIYFLLVYSNSNLKPHYPSYYLPNVDLKLRQCGVPTVTVFTVSTPMGDHEEVQVAHKRVRDFPDAV